MLCAIVPFLQVHNAERYVAFLSSVFDASLEPATQYSDLPIPHRRVHIGNSPLEIAETTAEFPPTRIALHAYFPDADALYARAIEAGVKSLMAPVDQPYGDREAAIEDAAGNYWYVATHTASTSGHVPVGLRTITPYLHIVGAAGFIRFVEHAFEAATEESHTSPDGSVLHAKVSIGDGMLELSDAHDESHPMLSAIHLHVRDLDAAYQRALKSGATSLRKPIGRDGERMACLTDAFGHSWYLDAVGSRE